jgi:hypothetical protein
MGAAIAVFGLGAAVPGVALAQYYEYLATGTISKVQAVDENGSEVAGYDYSKYTAEGIIVGGSASYSTIIDSATPDTPPDPMDPNAATQGTYLDAFPSVTIGSVTMKGMTLNNGVAVFDNRAAGLDSIPLPHDVLGYGGSFPLTVVGPGWIAMNNAEEPDQKGSAVILVEAPTTAALTGIGLPTALNLAAFTLIKLIAVDTLDQDTGQRVTVEATVATLSVDLDAPAPPTEVPASSTWAIATLAAALLAAAFLLPGLMASGGIRRNEV